MAWEVFDIYLLTIQLFDSQSPIKQIMLVGLSLFVIGEGGGEVTKRSIDEEYSQTRERGLHEIEGE